MSLAAKISDAPSLSNTMEAALPRWQVWLRRYSLVLVVYLGALALLFLSAFWRQDPLTSLIQRHWNLDNFRTLWRVSVYRTRGVPVYALLQSDGTARVYAGAFKTPEEATSLFDALKTSGVSTSLVVRTGRVY